MFVNCADIAIGDKSLFKLNNFTANKNQTVAGSRYNENSDDSDENDDDVDHDHQTQIDHQYHYNNGHAHVSYPVLNTTHFQSKKPKECGRCYALPTWSHFSGMDNWCETNCKLGNCPPCRCYCGCPDLKFENPCEGKEEYSKHSQMAGWCRKRGI